MKSRRASIGLGMTAILVLAVGFIPGCMVRVSKPKPTTAAGPVQATAPVVQPTSSAPPGRDGAVPRPDLLVKAENRLRNVGVAYRNVAGQGLPVTGPQDLKAGLDGGTDVNALIKGFEVVWNVDPTRVPDPSNTMLAWEKARDTKGGRAVLMADGSVRYLLEPVFLKTMKAQPNS